MNRTCHIAVGLLVAVMLIPALVSAQGKALALGKKGDVVLTAVTSIGPAALQPGSYRFQYLEQDGRHYLIARIRQEERLGSRRQAVGSGTEVARVVCLLVPLGQRIRETSLVLKTDPDGTRRISEIRIRGEAASHVIALEPKGEDDVPGRCLLR